MGTRSNTVIIETAYGKPFRLVNIYRQMDGYPSGHGKELADFLGSITMCNGIGLSGENEHIANGAGCLAAQLIAHLKTEPGSIYLDKPTGHLDNDYAYLISANTLEPEQGINVEVKKYSGKVFNGTVPEFAEWVVSEKANS